MPGLSTLRGGYVRVLRLSDMVRGNRCPPHPNPLPEGEGVSCLGYSGRLIGRRHGSEIRTTSRCTGEVTMGPVSDM